MTTAITSARTDRRVAVPVESHPICTGGYAALVFSGARAALGELPGEMTADTLFKFAMIDPRLPAAEDFARGADSRNRGAPGVPLRIWPEDRLRPTDGVCFVLSDRAHPALERLARAGAIEGEHFVIAEDLYRYTREAILDDRLARWLEALDPQPPVLILGYGDQGARIAGRLRDRFEIAPERLIVFDANPIARGRAADEGFIAVDDVGEPLARAGGVISSPLQRHERLHALLQQARRAGLATLENGEPTDESRHFRGRGPPALDAAASRALVTDGWRIRPGDHGLPIEAVIVRHDRRRLGGVIVDELRAGQRMPMTDPAVSADLSQPDPADPLDPATFADCQRAYVSLRDRPALSVFAAREFCQALWPEATGRVFPSPGLAGLGTTDFERLIARHVHGAEIARASQTSGQQVVLGVVAAHYAGARPIIEIGSALGGSALLMAVATGSAGGVIHSIDPGTATRDVMRFIFQREGLARRLRQHVMRSDEAIQSLSKEAPEAGIVFIDGLHTEEATLADYRNYAPLVRPGGALLVHDVEPARLSVLRVVLEHILPDERFVPRCLVDGLAVFERVGEAGGVGGG